MDLKEKVDSIEKRVSALEDALGSLKAAIPSEKEKIAAWTALGVVVCETLVKIVERIAS